MKEFKTSLLWIILCLAMMAGCNPPKTTSSTGTTVNPLPAANCNPPQYGQTQCPNYCSVYNCNSTTGTTNGGSTGSTSCNPPQQGDTHCPNYCQVFNCGGTNGGTTGGHPYTNTIPSDNNWQALYPNGVPAENCSAPTGTGFGLRKGTVTMAGGTWYSPALPFGSQGEPEYSGVQYTHNISSYLVNVNEAKGFYDTDAKLKVRFKVRPQILPPANKSWCFGRVPRSPDPYGYTALRFNVSVRGVNPDGSLKPALQGTRMLTVPLNSCSPAVDFSGFNQQNPDGLVVIIHDVQKDSGCWYSQGCNNVWVTAKDKDCWQMDLDVSVDGTKDIN